MTQMHSSEKQNFIVELLDINKHFGGIKALENVNLQVRGGEIHALVGENGAGKSTLMKILSGIHYKNGGQILVEGKEVEIKNTKDSQNLGIGIIHQEFSLVPDLSVAENIFLNQLDAVGIWMKWNELRRRSKKIIKKLGFTIDTGAKVKNLSIAEQQIVEIAKALALDVRILILDEPSAVLGPREIDSLFRILRKMRENGTAIIYISHRLNEIFQLCDRVTVLRNGTSSDSYQTSQLDKNKIISFMLGRKLEAMFPHRDTAIGDTCLEVKNVSVENRVRDISFSVRCGEVLGIAGLVGSGRTEVLQAIFSSRAFEGEVCLLGKKLHLKSPSAAVKSGIGMVPEDRKAFGIITSLSIKKNISLSNLKKISGPFGFIKTKKERERVDSLIQTLNIKTINSDLKAKNLSGGNQQKVVMAKWLNQENNKVMLIDEPTRGVDVGAKVEIYREINKMASKGLGIVVVSSDTPELLGICDRILVMKDGAMSGELLKDQFSEENVLKLAISDN